QTGKAIRWNKAFNEVSGYTDEEISSMKAPDSYYSKEDLKRAAEATKEVKNKGSTKVEMSLISKNNKSSAYEYSGTLVEDLEGNLLIVSIGRDISERKRFELELKESEEKFRSIADQSIVGISVVQDNKFKYFNNKLIESTGYSVEEMKSWTINEILNLIHPEDRKFVVEQANKKQRGDPDVINQYQHRIITKDGQTRWLEVFSKTINFEGRPASLVINIDNTDKIKAEQELKESEEKFRSITEQLLMGIFILQDNTLKYLNKKACEIIGYSAEEMKSWGPSEILKIVHPDDREFTIKQSLKKQAGDQDVIEQYHYRIIRKDGTIRWLEIFSKTITYEDRYADLVMLIDVTEKIKAEQDLKESEEKFRRITEQSLIGITVLQNGVFKYFNKKFVEINGYSEEEVNNWAPHEWVKVIHPEDREFVAEQARKKQVGNTDVINQYKFRILRADGEIRWLELFSKTINYEGSPADLALTTDITDKIKIEMQLKESEEKFRTITEQAIMGITVIQDGLYKYFNQRVCENSGYSREEIENWAPNEFANLFHPEDKEFVMEQAKKKQRGDTDVVNRYPYRMIRKDGEIRWIEVSSKSIIYEGHTADLTMTYDITDKINAEQLLKESEEKFRNIADQSIVGITIIQDGLFKYFNKRVSEINGYSPEEIKNWAPGEFVKIIHPEDQEFVMEQARKKQEGDSDVVNQYQYRIVTKDGKTRWLEIFSKTINYEGRPADMAMTVEITDKIKAEQKLKESEKRYRLISEASRAVIWTSDFNINLTYVDPIVLKIFGATSEEVMALPLSSYLTPKSLETAKRVIEEELKHEMSKDKDLNRSRTYETIQIHKNGTKIPVESTITFLRDENEKAIGILGISRDISERKKAENQLKESEKKYREAYDMVTFYKDLFTHDMNNILHIIGSSVEIIDLQLGESEKSLFIENMTKMIHSQVKRGSKLISDVRTLTELDDAEIPINRVNITKFLKRSINFIEKSYTEKNLSIFVKNLDRKYYTSGNDLLQDVFDNILRNGIKHNENPDIQLSIKISKQKIKGKKNIKIEFIDNGIGIPENRKSDIFQPSNRERKGSKGMGIGLSLVKKILTIFKGKIWVEDKIEGDYTQGSKFIVLLPEAN
ncbi:MAG: PAS domain S-box protein, partial [Promethearchaeota archaeon]